jgi:ABC-type uncharacterized transport system auxiliary subunit
MVSILHAVITRAYLTLLTGCLETDEAGHTTSEFPLNSYATPSTTHSCFLLQSFRPSAHKKADSDNLVTRFS